MHPPFRPDARAHETCLVTSGCHGLESQEHFRTDPAHFYAGGVGELVPEVQ